MALMEKLNGLNCCRKPGYELKGTILQMGLLVNPILRQYELGLEAPIAIECKNQNQAESILNKIRSFGNSVFALTETSKKDLEKCYQLCDYEIFPMICYNDSAKSRENIGHISHLFLQKKSEAIPVIFCPRVPKNMRELVSGRITFRNENMDKRVIEKNVAEHEVRHVISLICENHTCLHRTLTNLHISGENAEKKFLVAAEKMCEFVLELDETDEKDKFLMQANLRRCLEQMMEEWDMQEADLELTEEVRACILNHIPRFAGALDRKCISGDRLDKIGEYLLFDIKYYYFTSKQMDEICKPMKNFISVLQMKELLEDADILVGEGRSRGYMSVKVPVYTSEGVADVGRRIRLRRAWLDMPGELTLQEKIKEAGGKNHDHVRACKRRYGESPDCRDCRKPAHLDSGAIRKWEIEFHKKIENCLVTEEARVLAMNFNGTHDDVKEENSSFVINVKKDGIPMPLFKKIRYPDGTTEEPEDISDAIVDAFARVARLGYIQRDAFAKACKRAVEQQDDSEDDMKNLYISLASSEEDASKEVIAKFRTVLTRIRFSKSFGLWKDGKITVLDFCGYPSSVQILLAELALSVLWRHYQAQGQRMEKPTWIVLDEFQNLPMREGSVLPQILREGRKFNLSLLLATQTLASFDRGKRALLQQPATKLFFKPVEADLRDIAKSFPDLRLEDAQELLRNLKRGECLASGVFHLGGKDMRKTLKMSFWEE